jgi:anaerobic selenocysteine-containing dehydrogenase
MTLRSHDQFNTTIYGLDDRYRGIHNERRVLFLNPQDITTLNLQPRQIVDLASHFQGQTRHARHFIIVPYDIPQGCCAAYYPEANPLVPIGSTANRSNQPTSKYVLVTVTPTTVKQPFDYTRTPVS